MSRPAGGWRRFAVAIQVAALAVALSSLSAHHIARFASFTLISFDHIGAFCMVALHELLQPVHLGFHVVLLAGIAYATFDRVRAWRASSRIMRIIHAGPVVGLPPKIAEAAARIGVPAYYIRAVTGLPVPAFTAGWCFPRIYVSADTEAFLSTTDLAAVLAHEYHHVRNRDPLRVFVVRFIGSALFWLPSGATLGKVAADNAELAADDAAALAVGRISLANALVRIAQRFTRGGPALSSPIHSPHLLERRISRLIGVAAPADEPQPLVKGLAAATAVLLLVVMSGGVMTHPAEGHSSHCEHEHGTPLSHLTCKFKNPRTDHCPHSTSGHAENHTP